VVLPLTPRTLEVIVIALSEVRDEAPLMSTVLLVSAVKLLPFMVVPVAVRLLEVIFMALSDFRFEPLARVMALPVSSVTELALMLIAPVPVRVVLVILRALSVVMVPPEALIVVLVAVMELALMVELPFIITVLLLMGMALEDVRLLDVPSMTMLLLFFIVMELAFIVLPSCMVKLLPSDVNALLVFRVDLSESVTLLPVKEDALRFRDPPLPDTSMKVEVKSAVELLTLSVVLAMWMESLVKLAELKVTSAFICMRVWLTVEVLFELDRGKLTATLSLSKLTLLKVAALLISSVSFLKRVDPLLKLKFDVIFTVPPMKVQPLQVPLEFSKSVQPAGILIVQPVHVPEGMRDDQDWLLPETV
jgi:hypothetical protein